MVERDEAVRRGAEALDDLLTMLGVNPQERPEHGGDSIAETLAGAVLNATPPSGDVIEATAQLIADVTGLHGEAWSTVTDVPDVRVVAQALAAAGLLAHRIGES